MNVWRDDVASDELNALLGEILSMGDRQMPRACPHCGVSAVHVYLHGRGDRLGGVWIWCSGCRSFMHGSVRAPMWWQNLDTIDPAKLVATPEYLDEVSAEIDRHWAHLPAASPVSVVEMRSLQSLGDEPETWARFVLGADGQVRVVGNTPNAKRYAEKIMGNGVPGPRGGYVKMDAGLEFLRLLVENFRGTREWATRVFEMDEDQAMVISPVKKE